MAILTMNSVLINLLVACVLLERTSTVGDSLENQMTPIANGRQEQVEERLELNISGSSMEKTQDVGSRLENLDVPSSPVVGAICANSSLCEDVLNYPRELIRKALHDSRNEHLFWTRNPRFRNRVTLLERSHSDRYEPRNYTALCATHTELVFPKAAKTDQNEWAFVVNIEDKGNNESNFHQVYEVNICTNEKGLCKDGFGYRRECRQNYVGLRTLLWQNHQLIVDWIRIPSSCNCHMVFTGGP